MSDLSDLLPNFDQKPWKHLTFSLEKKGITTSELVGSDPKWLAKFIPLPLREVERMANAVILALHEDVSTKNLSVSSGLLEDKTTHASEQRKFANSPNHRERTQFISTLDQCIDDFLRGGIPAGYVTEIVGESAAGKSQFVHGLLLAATLKPPHGPGKTALYVTTEDDLMTSRLEQILDNNPTLEPISTNEMPNLDHIFTVKINTIAEQESVITHRLRPEIKRRNIGLVVIDSITAHFRAQFGGNNPKILAARAAELQNLGKSLQQMAHEDNIAVVITNQVSDRFDDIRSIRVRNEASSLLDKRNSSIADLDRSQPIEAVSQARRERLLSLDHQQMFFTGWGDDLSNGNEVMKTPALGLAWTNQLDARIALKVVENTARPEGAALLSKDSRSRFMKVVFAKWTTSPRLPLRYELRTQGITGVMDNHNRSQVQLTDGNSNAIEEEDSKFLDPKYWEDDSDLDELTT